MNPALRWRAEFYRPGPGTNETVVGHVDGDAKSGAWRNGILIGKQLYA